MVGNTKFDASVLDRVDAPNEFELEIFGPNTDDVEGVGINDLNGLGIMETVLVLGVTPETISSL